MFSVRDFVDMVKLKQGLQYIYIYYRCKLMFQSINTNCLRRWCNYKYDRLNHIMQTCRFNYNTIINRHIYVNDLYMVKLKQGLQYIYIYYRCKLMFQSINTNCLRRWCNYKYDCLNHIMQTCRFNYNTIIHRHIYVNDLLITLLNK